MATKKTQSKFMAPLKVSDELAKVVGKGPLPRTEVVKKVWSYIKQHNLQDPKNKREIRPDDNLGAVFGTKDNVNMFKMPKLINDHLS